MQQNPGNLSSTGCSKTLKTCPVQDAATPWRPVQYRMQQNPGDLFSMGCSKTLATCSVWDAAKPWQPVQSRMQQGNTERQETTDIYIEVKVCDAAETTGDCLVWLAATSQESVRHKMQTKVGGSRWGGQLLGWTKHVVSGRGYRNKRELWSGMECNHNPWPMSCVYVRCSQHLHQVWQHGCKP